MGIILASQSPRRRQLLEMLGLDFVVIPAKGEEVIPSGMSPGDTVRLLSRQKAAAVAAGASPEDIVIAADTIVWHGGQVLGKPKNEQEAARMLSALSGNTHQVYTGITVRKGETVLSGAECTNVRFRKLSGHEIDAYIACGEPFDKAGGYGIQGVACLFVEGIEGDFFNVMGLPVCRMGKMLKELGVEIL